MEHPSPTCENSRGGQRSESTKCDKIKKPIWRRTIDLVEQYHTMNLVNYDDKEDSKGLCFLYANQIPSLKCAAVLFSGRVLSFSGLTIMFSLPCLLLQKLVRCVRRPIWTSGRGEYIKYPLRTSGGSDRSRFGPV